MISKAEVIGYQRMRLDMMSAMTEAMALYKSLGFKDITFYRPNPIKDAKFFQLVLSE